MTPRGSSTNSRRPLVQPSARRGLTCRIFPAIRAPATNRSPRRSRIRFRTTPARRGPPGMPEGDFDLALGYRDFGAPGFPIDHESRAEIADAFRACGDHKRPVAPVDDVEPGFAAFQIERTPLRCEGDLEHRPCTEDLRRSVAETDAPRLPGSRAVDGGGVGGVLSRDCNGLRSSLRA